MSDKLLEIAGLAVEYEGETAIEQIDLTVRTGEIVGIAGGSGSGKSTLLKAILPLGVPTLRIRSGKVVFDGAEISAYSHEARRRLAGTGIGIISQNPAASFNLTRTYGKQFAETLKSHGRWEGDASLKEISELFSRLNLPDAGTVLSGYPCQMSGGMNQRISIALAMLLKPKLMLADEPTSALDMEAQNLVIAQLLKLREEQQHATLFVTHNLGVAAKLCDQIVVMKEGRIVEYGDVFQVLLTPRHPYTRSLLAAVPVSRRK